MKRSSVPGLISIGRVTATRRRLYLDALDVLKRHEETGSPFALFLRTYRLLQLYGETPAGEGEYLLENRLLKSLHRRDVDLVTVQTPSHDSDRLLFKEPSPPRQKDLIKKEELLERLVDRLPHPFLAKVPALAFNNQEWLGGVTYLICRAELIVSDLQLQTPGATKELRVCLKNRRADRTVVVLPVPGGVVHSISKWDPAKAFPRTIYGHELEQQDPIETFVFRDLVERLVAIGRLPTLRRLALIHNGSLDKAFPIVPAGLAEGYADLASLHLRAGRPDHAALALQKAIQNTDLASGLAAAIRYRCELAGIQNQLGDFEEAIESFSAAESLLAGRARAGHSDDELLCHLRSDIVVLRSRVMISKGQVAGARMLLRRALASAKKRGDTVSQYAFLTTLAEAALTGGSPSDALRSSQGAAQDAQEAAELARTNGDFLREAIALNIVGNAYQIQGEDSLAVDAFNKALEILPQPGVHDVAWAAFMGIGSIAGRQGMLQEARDTFNAAAATAKALGDAEKLASAEDALRTVSERLAALGPEVSAEAKGRKRYKNNAGRRLVRIRPRT